VVSQALVSVLYHEHVGATGAVLRFSLALEKSWVKQNASESVELHSWAVLDDDDGADDSAPVSMVTERTLDPKLKCLALDPSVEKSELKKVAASENSTKVTANEVPSSAETSLRKLPLIVNSASSAFVTVSG